MDYPKLLQSIADQMTEYYGQGKVADYIPELGKVDPRQFAMCLSILDNGQNYCEGDAHVPFSIQSVSKVFTLMLCVSQVGESVYQRVGVEPSGDPFNSLIQLEYEKGFPRNPFINAGALVVSDILLSCYDDPLGELTRFVAEITETRIEIDEAVALSELRTGFRNYALAYLLKSFGRIKNPIDKVMDFYFHQCSMSMSCNNLAKAFLPLANHGVIPANGKRILTATQAKRINSIMQTCGFYDQAGEFTFCVGLPGKSGVGGGIGALMPNKFSIAVWSPELNPFGNSVLGMHALELFTTQTGESIF